MTDPIGASLVVASTPMSILDILRSDPDTVVAAATGIMSWLGFSGWRKKRAATAAEVDRWAAVAIGVVVAAIKSGVFNDNTAAVNAFLKRFRGLAAAAGVEVTNAREQRAMLIAQEAITAAVNIVAAADAARLSAVSEALFADMERMYPSKKKATPPAP